MEGLLILGLLIAGIAAGGPQPSPQDFGPPVMVQAKLVSLKLEPKAAYRGHPVYGYLALTPMVPDSPTRPVEEIEGYGRHGYLPAIGLMPRPFRLVADGRWHSPVLKEDWRRVGAANPDEYFATAVRAYPLIRNVGPRRQGEAALDIALYLEGVGWVQPTQRRWVWVPLCHEEHCWHEEQLTWDTPFGALAAFLRLRRRVEWVFRRREEVLPDGRRYVAVYQCPFDAPEWDDSQCVESDAR